MSEKVLNEDRTRELWVAVKTAIATALTEYTKSDEIAEQIATAIAATLTEYAKSTDVTREIQEAVSKLQGVSLSVVDRLPDSGEDRVIYLVPAANSTDQNAKDEYLWVDGKWEKIGSTSIDLSQYWNKEELTPLSSEELKEILK